jgi:putative PIN family toxin of toxin-antitoxin system
MKVSRRAIFDCNVYLQIMLSTKGAAGACWQKVLAGEAKLIVAPFILAEIRKLPTKRSLLRFSRFTAERVERFLEELLDTAALLPDPSPTFTYPRDPDDARYIDLAMAANTTIIVSNDKDLLDLMNDTNSEGKALRASHPDFRVCTPPLFLELLRADVPP